MKFVVSSAQLLNHLQAINKVINTKNTLPILDNFLFKLEGNSLEITASDLETTLITRLKLDNASEDGAIAIPAKFLTEYLSKFSEQPLTFDISTEQFTIRINSETGESNIMGYDWEDFPQLPTLKQDMVSPLRVSADLALQGIAKTIFATGEDELRPVMNGILMELTTDNITFVASDSHMLVRYRRSDAKAYQDGSFILPKKPAGLLRTVLAKEQGDVEISFDDKNALFQLSNYTMVCRLVEGNYPAYNSVIPHNNPNKLIIDRVEFLGSLRRVSMFTNQATNLVKMELRGNQVTILAQDIDFSIAGRETLKCQYDGDEMNIGFKANFLAEILANLSSTDICLEISDPSRACLVLPVQNEIEGEDVLMLIMPMTVSD
jgi:DNA polymerase-3 subunit beta